MSRRWLVGIATLALVLVGVVVSRAWPHDPGPIAPPVTAAELARVDHHQPGSVTMVNGGSKSQAHRLWQYYRQRQAFHGLKPQLLGISHVRVTGSPGQDGVYWLVFSDHVWQESFGPGRGGFAFEAVLVPDDGESLFGGTRTF
jgi:hypothetical protein